MPLDPELLAILCCPAEPGGVSCHGDLGECLDGLLCLKCGLVYPVEEGIPVLLETEARRLNP